MGSGWRPLDGFIGEAIRSSGFACVEGSDLGDEAFFICNDGLDICIRIEMKWGGVAWGPWLEGGSRGGLVSW